MPLDPSPHSVEVAPHPLLDLAWFGWLFPAPLGTLATPPEITAGLALDARAPFRRSDAVRAAVRDLLREGGYKPTGRGKPASEYLVGAAEAGRLTAINPAVDAINAASLASGLPISVVDPDLVRPPFEVRIGREGERYVFNSAGQEIDVAGLLVAADHEGPCANAVKDAQRAKTHAGTRRVVVFVWGTAQTPGLAAAVAAHVRALFERIDAGR
jgi:DNA/RNA-binding domain of Phe-tRNA-synthetase-like protein